MLKQADYCFSSYRERVLEHQLVGDLLRALWCRGAYNVEVLRPEVDGAGYDVILEYESVVRHIQLKATRDGGRRASVGVNIRLVEKPSGCVIWFDFDAKEMTPKTPFFWLGGKPGERLGGLGEKRGRHTKADSAGHKAMRETIRLVKRSAFEKIDSIDELAQRLFPA